MGKNNFLRHDPVGVSSRTRARRAPRRRARDKRCWKSDVEKVGVKVARSDSFSAPRRSVTCQRVTVQSVHVIQSDLHDATRRWVVERRSQRRRRDSRNAGVSMTPIIIASAAHAPKVAAGPSRIQLSRHSVSGPCRAAPMLEPATQKWQNAAILRSLMHRKKKQREIRLGR